MVAVTTCRGVGPSPRTTSTRCPMTGTATSSSTGPCSCAPPQSRSTRRSCCALRGPCRTPNRQTSSRTSRRWNDRNLPAAPVLAVEVLSPSTPRIDRLLKLSRYAAAGVEHYWIIDSDGPSVAYALSTTGTYDEVARVHGDETYTASAPFDVLITPKQLVAES